MNPNVSPSEEKRRNSPPFENPRRELSAALTRFFDVMYPAAIFFGGIGLAASIFRSIHNGWYATFLLHTAMYLSALIVLTLRRRLPVLGIFSFMIGLISTAVIHSLYNTGLAGEGMMTLSVLCIFVGVFLGLKAGIIAAAIGVASASLIGAGICNGLIITRPNIVTLISMPATWVTQIACFIYYTVPLIFAVNGMHRRMNGSLDALRKTNERLQSEVSMRIEAERESRESEARYRNIFENAVEGIFQTDPQGRLLSVNPSLARMSGFDSPEEMILSLRNMNGDFYADPSDGDRVKKQLHAEGCIEGCEVEMRRKDGTVGWISMSARVVKNDEGLGTFVEGTVEDITKRRKAEVALQESEFKYRTVVESSLLAFYVVQDDRFRFVNTAFCAISGYAREEVVDTMNPLDIIHPDDRDRVKERLTERLNGAKTLDNYELKAVKKDGTIVIAKVMGSGFIYNGKPAAFGTLIDITKERTLESQLRQSQKMEAIGTLAGGVAHDFNNILTALTGYGTLLQMKLDKNDPLRHYADQILSASQKGAGLTQSLLAFGRLQPISLRPLNISSAVRGTEKLLRRLVTEDISLITDLSPEDTVVMADPTQIDQILFNLVTNGRDAMPGGGSLHIATKTVKMDNEFILIHGFGKTGWYQLLSFADTGTGMDERTMQKIFDPFFTTKEIGKGTGLGLSTVYGIVKQHNGYITVQSEIGRGAVFHIYIPAVKTQIYEIPTLVPRTRRGKETVLVAEDNEDVRFFIKEMLDEHGYDVIEAVDGTDAVAKFSAHKGISLVILDSVMPKKNGREAYDEMRAVEPGIRALFMSGYTSDVVLEKGVREYQLDFIAKPLSPEEFLTKIGDILDGA